MGPVVSRTLGLKPLVEAGTLDVIGILKEIGDVTQITTKANRQACPNLFLIAY